MSRGMSRQVAIALGLAGREPRIREGVLCQTCGSSLDFRTDFELRLPNPYGRVIEVCPRGCRTQQHNGVVDRARANGRLLDQALRQTYVDRDYGRARCARRACGTEFTKRSKTQRFCSRACVDLTQSERMSGLRGRKPRRKP